MANKDLGNSKRYHLKFHRHPPLFPRAVIQLGKDEQLSATGSVSGDESSTRTPRRRRCHFRDRHKRSLKNGSFCLIQDCAGHETPKVTFTTEWGFLRSKGVYLENNFRDRLKRILQPATFFCW